MLSLVLLRSFLLSLLLLHVQLLALKLRDTARAGRCGLQEPAARQGFALHAVPGWEDGPESSSPAQTRKAEPGGLTAKDPAAKKQFSHRRPKSRRVPAGSPGYSQASPAGCNPRDAIPACLAYGSSTLGSTASLQRGGHAGAEPVAPRAHRPTAGSAPRREHPRSTHRTSPPTAPTYRYLPRSQTFLVCYHGNPLPQ